MAARIETMAEPLPGYRLIERLGGGGFGEVWKAEAPGGLFKAIKFVYGDLEAADDDSARAEQERKALCRLIERDIRHAFILSLERIEIVDKRQLIIVSELADRTLWDRYRECRGQGLPGIPREELLRYLTDTAEALDYMNTQHQLQHLDIKPQNLFLVHNHVKVADFGLVKLLEGITTNVTGGVTPVYAAPETFEGKVSRFSDQYSLAIVYQELLTGQRPYTGQTLRQLVLQHCQGTPDLKSLPEFDRPIVLHAMAKNHEERFPTCLQFVDALRLAGQPTARPLPVAPASPASVVEDDGGKTEGRPNARAAPTPGAEEAWPQPVARRQGSSASDPFIVASSPGKSSSETPSSNLKPAVTPSTPRKSGPVVRADGVLLPALVVGLGQFGLGTLRQLRQEISDNFGAANLLPALRFLYLDTDPETAQRATRGTDEVALRPSEILLARLHRPSHYAKPREGTTGLETWLNPKMLYRMPRQQTPSGIRALGRLAFVDNYKTIARRLQMELADCCSPDALERTCAETGLSARSAVPRVFLVTNLAGGSGSGMLVDLAYLVQQQLRQLGHEGAEVVGVCYLPPADANQRRSADLANTFAALTELNHFSASSATFSARYELGEIRPGTPVFTCKGPPLHRCQFFALPEGNGGPIGEDSAGGPSFPAPLAKTFGAAARCVFAELTTPLGRKVEDLRQHGEPTTLPTAGPTPLNALEGQRPALFQLVGLDRHVWPRRQLLDLAAAGICQRLVQRWMSKDAKPLKETVKQWVQETWEEYGLTSEQVISRCKESCEKNSEQPPETVFQTIHESVVKGILTQCSKGEIGLNLAVAVEAMEQFEQMVGIPEEFQPTPARGEPASYQPGFLETALQNVAGEMIQQYEQKMNELAVRLIEDPSFRLAGAEEALRQLHAQVEQALQAQEQLAQELLHRSTTVYKRIQQLTSSGTSGSGTQTSSLTWKQPFARRSSSPSATACAAELQELLRSYPKVRYQGLIMARITALYVSLRGQLSDQLREVDFCRARLGELLTLFAAAKAKSTRGEPAAGLYIFADGCKSLLEAVRQLDTSVAAFDLVELDGHMQTLIRKQFRALVHVCMAPANVLKALAPAMQKETRAFLRKRMGEINVAEIFLQQFPDQAEPEECMEDQLAEGFERAAPEILASPPARELNLFAVPPGNGEDKIRVLASHAIADKTLVPVPSTDEIAFYREHTLGCLADLKQLGPAGQEAYHKMIAKEHCTPHNRADIIEWGTRSEVSKR
jgi:serine/threonine protein kinase